MSPEVHKKPPILKAAINKDELYEALTGGTKFDHHERMSYGHGRPVMPLEAFYTLTWDDEGTLEQGIDRAYILVKRMQRTYREPHALAEYYRTCFEHIDKAYLDGDPEKFRDALQELIDSIHAE